MITEVVVVVLGQDEAGTQTRNLMGPLNATSRPPARPINAQARDRTTAAAPGGYHALSRRTQEEKETTTEEISHHGTTTQQGHQLHI